MKRYVGSCRICRIHCKVIRSGTCLEPPWEREGAGFRLDDLEYFGELEEFRGPERFMA